MVGTEALLDLLARRRSIGRLAEPAPTDDELAQIFRAAVAAPDHGELRPWRFVVLRGGAKVAFGEVLADALRQRCRADGIVPTEGQITKERTKLGRAPLVVVAAAVPMASDLIPWVEQQHAVVASAQNILLAATALGYGSMWRTGEPAYDERVIAALGLAAGAAIVAFLYIGTIPEGGSKPAHEGAVEGVVTEWAPPLPPRSQQRGLGWTER